MLKLFLDLANTVGPVAEIIPDGESRHSESYSGMIDEEIGNAYYFITENLIRICVHLTACVEYFYNFDPEGKGRPTNPKGEEDVSSPPLKAGILVLLTC